MGGFEVPLVQLPNEPLLLPVPGDLDQVYDSWMPFIMGSFEVVPLVQLPNESLVPPIWDDLSPVSDSPEDPLVQHIAFPNELLELPVQGDLSTLRAHNFTIADLCGAGEKLRGTPIGMLSDDMLLEIFDLFQLDAMAQSWGSPWEWHRLAHVCRKWRHVISMSPRRLNLRILCENKAPIENILSSWPTVPLVVRFSSMLKSEPMPSNVMVALHHPHRLCEIDLDVTSSMAGSFFEAIQKPCQLLECIRITVKDAMEPRPLVRDAFLGGSAPHLREIKLDGTAVPFPEIRQVLSSTNNLVELHLANIPNDVYFPPDDLATGLTTLVRLKWLTVGFHSPAFPQDPSKTRAPPSKTRVPPQRIALPSLTFLDFHGASEYLEGFVARIYSPNLCEITIRFFNDISFEIPQFCQFVPHLNALGSPTCVFVTHSVDRTNVVFKQENSPNVICFSSSCRQLDWQLSFVTEISSQLSHVFPGVRSLNIQGLELPTGEETVDLTQWLELFQPFTHVTQVNVWVKQFVPGIVQALVSEDMATGVLPELTSLYLSWYRSSPSVAKAAERFVASRRLSGRFVSLI